MCSSDLLNVPEKHPGWHLFLICSGLSFLSENSQVGNSLLVRFLNWDFGSTQIEHLKEDDI